MRRQIFRREFSKFRERHAALDFGAELLSVSLVFPAVYKAFFHARKLLQYAFYFLRNISFQTHASWKEINIGMSDHICIVAGAALLLMLLYDYLMSKRNQHRRLERQPILLRWTIYYLIVFALFAYGKFGTENFIYLQF